MSMGNQPIFILKEGSKREKGKDAQYNNIMAARAIADAVRSTLGPRGMDKMLVDSMGDVVITNDGVTILKEIDVEHPAAKMLVEVAKTQDEECGDGTTTAVILTGELLKKSIDLIDANVHPTIITAGYRMAANKAMEVLDSVAVKVEPKDRETLMKIAKTAMMSKSISGSKDLMAAVSVDSISSVAEKVNGKWQVDMDNIQVTKKHGGSMDDTQLIPGIIVDKEPVHPAMPKRIEKAKIALLDVALEIKKTEIDAKIEISDPTQMHAFLDEEERMLKQMVEAIKKVGANVVFCQKGIDDLVQHFLAKEKIYAGRRVKKGDMEKLSKATGATIISKISELDAADLGKADLVEVRKIQDEEMTFVTGCKNPKAMSILIRGGTDHVIAEIERSLDDAMSVVAVAIEDGRMLTGGGSTAVEVALRLREFSSSVGGREQIAIDAYASALEVIPTALAENAGLDPIDLLIEMRKSHKAGKKHAGVNVFTGQVEDMLANDVVEPFRVGKQAISSATDAAVMILRIDDVIASRGTPGMNSKDMVGKDGLGDTD
ncbi:MAG TPA: thermosome subunit beta [Methanomassiliicoccales archaeon]|nr:thermosome subunit beta [Methanomassiliicoccales archaeon]HPR98209.1 thermosome subunit beta [Methanomassiliicoccales archaeon]